MLLWVKEVLLALMLAPLSDYGWQLEICRCAWTMRDAALVLLVHEAEVSKQLQSAMVATGNWEVSSADIIYLLTYTFNVQGRHLRP